MIWKKVSRSTFNLLTIPVMSINLYVKSSLYQLLRHKHSFTKNIVIYKEKATIEKLRDKTCSLISSKIFVKLYRNVRRKEISKKVALMQALSHLVSYHTGPAKILQNRFNSLWEEKKNYFYKLPILDQRPNQKSSRLKEKRRNITFIMT